MSATVTTRPRPFLPRLTPGAPVGWQDSNPATGRSVSRRGRIMPAGTDGRPVLPGHVLVEANGALHHVHVGRLRFPTVV